MAHNLHGLQRAVIVEWHGGVEEQVLVADIVHATVTEDGTYMLAQFLGDAEGMVQLLHEGSLLLGKSPAPSL